MFTPLYSHPEKLSRAPNSEIDKRMPPSIYPISPKQEQLSTPVIARHNVKKWVYIDN